LSLLAVPLNAAVVRALADGPLSLADLRDAAGSPPQTTMRDYLRGLREAGVLERQRSSQFPGTVRYELTLCGRDLLQVALDLATWLGAAPKRPVELASGEAKIAIQALLDGWTSGMVRALAARALTLTELDSVISTLTYPSLERRLATMREVGLLEAVRGKRGTPHLVSDWLRHALVPLAAATRWEHRHMADRSPPLTKRDVETVFLLAIPLVRLPESTSCRCRLGVQMNNGSSNRLVGAMVEVSNGRVASCTTRLEGRPDAWAVGSTAAWFSAVRQREPGHLELGGETALAREMVDRIHDALLSRPLRT